MCPRASTQASHTSQAEACSTCCRPNMCPCSPILAVCTSNGRTMWATCSVGSDGDLGCQRISHARPQPMHCGTVPLIAFGGVEMGLDCSSLGPPSLWRAATMHNSQMQPPNWGRAGGWTLPPGSLRPPPLPCAGNESKTGRDRHGVSEPKYRGGLVVEGIGAQAGRWWWFHFPRPRPRCLRGPPLVLNPFARKVAVRIT